MPYNKDFIKVGCYSAFWGDSNEAALQLVESQGASLDYLVADYLAEITMGIFAGKRLRRQGKPGDDYVGLFLTHTLPDILPQIINNKTKIVTNAGALDPYGCKRAVEQLIEDMQLTKLKVAVVAGDDLLGNNSTTLQSFPELQSFSPLSSTQHTLEADRLPGQEDTLLALNAYLGAKGIAAALAQGADIVVTGRVVDSALVVGPLLYEYQWHPDTPGYYDLLASASLAGHIIECGCHSTGGNFTDWKLVTQTEGGGYANMGYPIVEFDHHGEFVVTKPDGTGGVVNPGTVSEQILYETMDPALYIMPDVIVDLRQVKLNQLSPNRVHVSGARGLKPTPWVKCCGIFIDGYQAHGDVLIAGHEAKQKALTIGNAIRQRCSTIFKRRQLEDFRDFKVEAVGGESLYGPHASSYESREIILRVSAHHDDPAALAIFAREINPMVTSGAPAMGFYGLPVVLPNMVHFPALFPKKMVKTVVVVGKEKFDVEWEPWDDTRSFGQVTTTVPTMPIYTGPLTHMVKTRLIDLAYGRSGDKGDVSNIGIIARDPRYVPYIKRAITEQAVANYMRHLCNGQVKRYELPGLHAFNFVLTKALGGGGISSLIVDRQGKTYAQLVLSGMFVDMPVDLAPTSGSKL
ncbi:uncharacterized protein BX664DRAFT_338500 [Halteromyces radiatus]|uniref:uncharacterized protein n=1 Tax=Halteromyces radiatus TaxID=101107 RepID=UPI0022208B26|nr:uncharacterized protein BX664DRAFT_338500 [Halteromyces radiatus]KAI8085089.1 hypothetical protein BX664DRAFT_338500 [Halteromyces radiatus]